MKLIILLFPGYLRLPDEDLWIPHPWLLEGDNFHQGAVPGVHRHLGEADQGPDAWCTSREDRSLGCCHKRVFTSWELSDALRFIIVENWVSSLNRATCETLCLLSSFGLWCNATLCYRQWMLHNYASRSVICLDVWFLSVLCVDFLHCLLLCLCCLLNCPFWW